MHSGTHLMNDFIHRRRIAALVIGAALLTGACGKDTKGTAGGPSESAAPKPSPGIAATGKTIIVTLTSDATGNAFTPSEIVASVGDTVRFTIGVGVHNVNFLPDSNPGKAGLPKASDMLQLPGQTYDLSVTFASGRYYFQCDPHVLLGMKGHLTVR